MFEDNLFFDCDPEPDGSYYLPCLLCPDYKVHCNRDCGNCDFPAFVKKEI